MAKIASRNLRYSSRFRRASPHYADSIAHFALDPVSICHIPTDHNRDYVNSQQDGFLADKARSVAIRGAPTKCGKRAEPGAAGTV